MESVVAARQIEEGLSPTVTTKDGRIPTGFAMVSAKTVAYDTSPETSPPSAPPVKPRTDRFHDAARIDRTLTRTAGSHQIPQYLEDLCPPMKTIAIHTLGILLATTPIFAATRATDSSAWSNEVRAWRTKLDANDPGMKSKWFQPDIEDSDWKTTEIPTALEHALPGHDGTVWYRRTLTLSKKDADLPHTLNLGPIDDMDMAWVNGVQVGGVEIPGYWLKPRSYAVPAKLLKTGRNIIVVRVIDHGWGGGFTGRPNHMSLTRKGSRIPLNGDWRYRAGASLNRWG